MSLAEILGAVFTPASMLWIMIGVLAGLLVGVIPGLTATVAIALLVPLTFDLEPLHSLLMLTGIFSGSMYSNSITSITLRTPGNPAGAVTILDGYPLALRGEAGRAVGLAAWASVVGGVLSVIALTFLAPPLASIALEFSPAEYFAVGLLGLTTVIAVSGRSVPRAIVATAFGLLVGTVGMDPLVTQSRFTFGQQELTTGIPFLPAVIGLFALAEVFRLAGERKLGSRAVATIGRVLPTRKDLKQTARPITLGSIIGILVGILPGGGGAMASFLAYGESKRYSKHPEEYGKGSIEGLTAADSANNGVTGGAMVPLLTLGIPGDAVTAVMLGALMVQGIQPGPRLFEGGGDLVYPLFLGMLVANILMFVVAMALAKPLASIAMVPYSILLPGIAMFSFVGSFAATGRVYDLWVALLFGFIGYLMNKFDYPIAAVALGLILGPIIESNLRRGLVMSGGDWSIFVTRPISLGLILVAAALLVFTIIQQRRRRANAEFLVE
ncbi:tripartite tricarboxylate transporter permease [Ornithinimicrobium faecis]|uniref:tripartite tricarboxylate transporter permease n=1 Tax=Ornithinimicrobium faecis TaxID=2934158 RepID=UPI002118638D|nr:tripartite tricarboxylate transporter permease [Ornithinimicrobium sp. HY1745]